MVRRLARALQRPADERGLSILEVLAALMVFGIVAAGLASSTSANLNLIGKSNGRQTATQLANTWLEEARALDFGELALLTGETFETSPTSPDAGVGGGGTTYNGETLRLLGERARGALPLPQGSGRALTGRR